MNVIFFIGHLGHGGAEGVVSTLTSQLAEREHKVTLVCSLNNQFYMVSDKVRVVDVRKWRYDTFVGSLPVRIYKKAANRFRDLVNIRRIIKAEKPDMVISFLISWLWQLILICTGKIPLVCAERNAMEYSHGRGNFMNKQILYRMAYGVQVMSRYDKAWLRGRYRHIYPMPNPLRFAPITNQHYDNLFDNRKNILACGRVHPQKGYEKLIMAFAKIAGDFPDWNVDICGAIKDEKYHNSLQGLISRYGLEGRVIFLGGRGDVDKLMQEHSVFCLSSIHEGFPNVLSESMANGMACISFDIVTGPSEIIMDGLDGIIVENQNVDALAEGLSQVLGDRELRYSLGLHAIENIRRYERDRVVDKWEKLFNNIINEYNNGKD